MQKNLDVTSDQTEQLCMRNYKLTILLSCLATRHTSFHQFRWSCTFTFQTLTKLLNGLLMEVAKLWNNQNREKATPTDEELSKTLQVICGQLGHSYRVLCIAKL